MPVIDSLVLKFEQTIARVLLEPNETVVVGDVLPHYAGKKYRALGTMSLIDGPDGEWKVRLRGAHDEEVRVRLVEVVVVEHTAPVVLGPTREDRERAVERARALREQEVREGRTSPAAQLSLRPRKIRGGKKAPSG